MNIQDMTDPSEAELYIAFNNELLDKLFSTIKIYSDKDGKIALKRLKRIFDGARR